MDEHDRISLECAERLLREATALRQRNTVYSSSIKKFICELCSTANWQPVLGRDGHQLGRLVRCVDCNAVYEQAPPPPPRMWGDKPAGPPRLKQGWADLPLDGNGDRGDGGD